MPGRWSMRRWTTFRVRICSVSTVFHPNNMILGIVGDFDSEVMRELIQKFEDKAKCLYPAIGVSV